MENHPVMLLAILASLFAAVLGLSQGRRRAPGHRILADLIALLPPAASLSLFYSLSAHMYFAFGAWPASLGDAGFPGPLAAHASIAKWCFGIVLLSTLFVLPIVACLSWFAPKGRVWLRLVRIDAVGCLMCFSSTLVAPPGFLHWWWD